MNKNKTLAYRDKNSAVSTLIVHISIVFSSGESHFWGIDLLLIWVVKDWSWKKRCRNWGY